MNTGQLMFECIFSNNNRLIINNYNENFNIIVEPCKLNGLFKQYYDNKIIFEGEYLNGKRNGKGKEYNYYGRLIFEGEYLNGERNGKGKDIDYATQIVTFEGEYLNGKRNGKGKEYDYKTGNLLFEGEYLNDKEWEGKHYDNSNNIIYY